jgi:hypothetical protein
MQRVRGRNWTARGAVRGVHEEGGKVGGWAQEAAGNELWRGMDVEDRGRRG